MDEIIQLIRQARGMLDRAEKLALERAQPEQAATAQAGDGYDNPQSPQSWLRFFRFLRAVQTRRRRGDRLPQTARTRDRGRLCRRTRNRRLLQRKIRLHRRRDPATDRRHLTPVGLAFIEQGRARFGNAIDQLS